MTIFFQRKENTLRNLEVVFSMRGREHIIANAHLLEKLQKSLVETLISFIRRFSLGFRAQGDGRAMRIGAADHRDIIPFQAMITSDNIT